MAYANAVKGTLAAVAMGLMLAGCGSSSDSNDSGSGTPAATTTVGGVAATGAAMAGASIVLHCGNGWTGATTTDSNGQWSLVVPSADLPCAIQASDGSQAFYALTLGNGSSIVSNVTPLTSLALSKTGTAPDASWFNALNDAGLQALATSLPAAISALQTALQGGGYTLPDNFDPFSVVFAAEPGDDYDALLEQLKTALASGDFNTLLATLAAGGDLPAVGGGGGGGGGSHNQPIDLSVSGGSIGASDIAPLVGSYAGNQGDYANPGNAVAGTDSCSITVAADGTVTVSAGGKSLSAAFNGEAGDQVIHPTATFTNALASDVSANTFAMVSVQSGYVTQATASHGDGGLNTSGADRVDCFVVNPHRTTLGSGVTASNGGATAADLPADYAGTYSDGSCTLSISNDGAIHLANGSTVLDLVLGGDEDDRVLDNSGTLGLVSITATDRQSDGQGLVITFSRNVSTGGVMVSNARLGSTMLVSYPTCSSLGKQ